jgi:hypothetical protein
MAQHEYLRIVLLTITMIKAISTFTDASGLLGGAGDMAGLTIAALALNPLCALAAFALTMQNRLGPAICVLAGTVVLNWLSDIVSLTLHDFDTSGGLSVTLMTVLQTVGYPLMAASAVVLALRGERLGAATVLIALPMLVAAASVATFAVGMAIYGF